MIFYDQYENLNTCDPRKCIASKIMKCNRIINNVFRKHLSAFGLTNSQMSLLFILSKKGPTKQSELSRILYLEKSSINRNLKRLLDSGHIKKGDQFSILITKAGLELVNRLVPKWDAAMSEAREKLGKKGDDALNTIFEQLTQN